MTVISQRTANLLTGKSLTDVELSVLKEKMPVGLTPDWLITILRDFRLTGVSFTLTEEDDESGMGADLRWLSLAQMFTEAFDCEPGISVIPMGFLPIGSCAIGSGDPYFLDLRTTTDNPPLVRVFHDFAAEGEIFPLEGIEVVSHNLSDFLEKATID